MPRARSSGDKRSRVFFTPRIAKRGISAAQLLQYADEDALS